MDLIKSIFSIGSKQIQKKELGLPKGFQWTLVDGVWTPFMDKSETYIEKGYKAAPIIQSIVSQIAQRGSIAPLTLMRKKNQKAYEQWDARRKCGDVIGAKAWRVKAFEDIEIHPFLKLMDKPNEVDTGRQLRESIIGYLLTTGNSIIYAASAGIGSRKGEPMELWTVPSPSVSLVMSDNRRNPIKGYTVNYLYSEPIEPYNIAHFKYWNPVTTVETGGYSNMFWGLSPLASSKASLSQRKAAEIAQGTLFKNMAPAGVLSGKGEIRGLSEEQATALNSTFNRNYMGYYDGGGIYVTPADVSWQEIGMSPVDLDLINWNNDFDKQIARIYRYPLAWLQEGGVVANSEEASKQFINNAVIPVLNITDDIWTKKVREWYKDDSLVVVSDTDVFPETQTDTAKLIDWMTKANVFSIEEIRGAAGYEDAVDESRVLVNRSVALLSDVLNESNPEIDNNSEDF